MEVFSPALLANRVRILFSWSPPNGTVKFPPSYWCASSIQRFCILSYKARLDNVYGNLNRSGDYNFCVTTYGVDYAENALCVNASKLDSQSNLRLSLTVTVTTSNTIASDPTATACMTYGV